MTAEAQPIAEPADEPARGPFEFSRLIRGAGLVAVVLALASTAGTFSILMGLTPIVPTQSVVRTAMYINGALVAFLIFVVAWEVVGLLRARWRGRAAARLHIRIVALFSFIAAAPAVLVAVIASVTLDRGLDNWFSTRTRAIVDNSLSIAQAYAGQQAQLMRADTLTAKLDLERARGLLIEDPDRFQGLLSSVARSRNLDGLFLIKSDGSVVAQSQGSDPGNFPAPQVNAIEEANTRTSDVLVIAPGATDVIGSVTKLNGYDDVLLYTARPLDPEVVRYLAMTGENVSEYRALEATRFGMQVAFGILFLGITMVVLLSAIWIGIGFANRLVAPIRRLIDAAKEVSRGNLDVAVRARSSDGDVGALGSTFNTMTSQLREQREELLAASDQIDMRRRFTEAVLSGVTAGVVGVDAEARITIANRSALRLLKLSEDEAIGQSIAEVVPQLGPVVEQARRDNRVEHRQQITIERSGRERTVNVRVTTEQSASHAYGYVITLDDITDLVTAQRSSAWADVARRIAHEIKNPLTPIQLSAERLRRKFGKVIQDDRAVFDQCTDTIIRQVGDIGRMVDEFSSFARMPKPAIELGNLAEAIRESVFLIEVAHPDIKFILDLPDRPLMGRFDARLMSQALTNVVKNATEAINAVPLEQRGEGRIAVGARLEDESIVVDITDNGVGLPTTNRHRLLEPYMTTREKGTGLGLAIVTKIVEDHGGRVDLLDAPAVASGGRGALVRIALPRLTGLSNNDLPAEAGAAPALPVA